MVQGWVFAQVLVTASFCKGRLSESECPFSEGCCCRKVPAGHASGCQPAFGMYSTVVYRLCLPKITTCASRLLPEIRWTIFDIFEDPCTGRAAWAAMGWACLQGYQAFANITQRHGWPQVWWQMSSNLMCHSIILYSLYTNHQAPWEEGHLDLYKLKKTRQMLGDVKRHFKKIALSLKVWVITWQFDNSVKLRSDWSKLKGKIKWQLAFGSLCCFCSQASLIAARTGLLFNSQKFHSEPQIACRAMYMTCVGVLLTADSRFQAADLSLPKEGIGTSFEENVTSSVFQSSSGRASHVNVPQRSPLAEISEAQSQSRANAADPQTGTSEGLSADVITRTSMHASQAILLLSSMLLFLYMVIVFVMC